MNRPDYERPIVNLTWRLDRLDDAVKQLRQRSLSGGGYGGGGSGARFGRAAAGGLSARVGDTLGFGNVAIYDTAGGVLVATGETVEAYNVDDEAVSAGILVALERDRSNAMIAYRQECEED